MRWWCAASVCVAITTACGGRTTPQLRDDPAASVPVSSTGQVPSESGWVASDGSQLLFVSLTIQGSDVTGFAHSAQRDDPTTQETAEIVGSAQPDANTMRIDVQVGDATWTGVISAQVASIDIVDADGSTRHVDLVPGTADTFDELVAASTPP